MNIIEIVFATIILVLLVLRAAKNANGLPLFAFAVLTALGGGFDASGYGQKTQASLTFIFAAALALAALIVPYFKRMRKN